VEQLPDNLKEELLIDAISKSPTSAHLYKYLIKVWGRKKGDSKAISELRIKKNHAEYLAGTISYS
jgi:hypothetical protein